MDEQDAVSVAKLEMCLALDWILFTVGYSPRPGSSPYTVSLGIRYLNAPNVSLIFGKRAGTLSPFPSQSATTNQQQ